MRKKDRVRGAGGAEIEMRLRETENSERKRQAEERVKRYRKGGKYGWRHNDTLAAHRAGCSDSDWKSVRAKQIMNRVLCQ